MKQAHQRIKDIIDRYTRGLYTQKDAETLFDTLKSGSGYEEMEEEMDRILYNLPDVSHSNLHDQYKKEAKLLLDKLNNRQKRSYRLPFMRYAAAIAILVIAGLGLYQLIDRSAKADILYSEVYVKNAEHKNITLPDGSEVILNAGSYLRYPTKFSQESRLVEINGEAFFDIQKDSKRPFIVRTDGIDVKVLGTSFNVKAYEKDEQLMVSVQTGKVQVDMPEAMMRLLPNEQMILDKYNGEFQKRNEDIKRVKSWIHGGLYFNRTPIKSVALELERMYDCRIELKEGIVFDEFIYGEHDNKSLESVLKSIEYTTNIKYVKEGKRYLLYKD